jgi:hypothetical protein
LECIFFTDGDSDDDDDDDDDDCTVHAAEVLSVTPSPIFICLSM